MPNITIASLPVTTFNPLLGFDDVGYIDVAIAANTDGETNSTLTYKKGKNVRLLIVFRAAGNSGTEINKVVKVTQTVYDLAEQKGQTRTFRYKIPLKTIQGYRMPEPNEARGNNFRYQYSYSAVLEDINIEEPIIKSKGSDSLYEHTFHSKYFANGWLAQGRHYIECHYKIIGSDGQTVVLDQPNDTMQSLSFLNLNHPLIKSSLST